MMFHFCRLLMDNFLNAYGVWWLPGALLSAAAFIFAAVYGVCVGLSGYVAWNGSAGHVDPTGESILLGVCSFVLALIVLNFCISVLLDVVDCVFVCYVMDLDRQRLSRPEVHEVYEEVKAKTAKVPSGTGIHGAMDGGRGSAGGSNSDGNAGAVVRGPGGNIAYGRGADDAL